VRQFRATLPDITLMDLQLRGMNVRALSAIRGRLTSKGASLSTLGGDAPARMAMKPRFVRHASHLKSIRVIVRPALPGIASQPPPPKWLQHEPLSGCVLIRAGCHRAAGVIVDTQYSYERLVGHRSVSRANAGKERSRPAH